MWLGNKTEGQIFFLTLQMYDLVVSYTRNIKVRFAPQKKEHTTTGHQITRSP